MGTAVSLKEPFKKISKQMHLPIIFGGGDTEVEATNPKNIHPEDKNLKR